jgi:hypothetical protein
MFDKFASASMHLESAPPNQTPDFLLSSHVDLIGGPHRSIHSCEILWCCLRRGLAGSKHVLRHWIGSNEDGRNRVSGINEAIVEFDSDHRGHLIGSMRRAV